MKSIISSIITSTVASSSSSPNCPVFGLAPSSGFASATGTSPSGAAAAAAGGGTFFLACSSTWKSDRIHSFEFWT